MNRRIFLKLVGAAVLAPSLPCDEKQSRHKTFVYRGQEFIATHRPEIPAIQLYMKAVINGETYCNAFWIEPEHYEKCRNMYCDVLLKSLERKKRELSGNSTI